MKDKSHEAKVGRFQPEDDGAEQVEGHVNRHGLFVEDEPGDDVEGHAAKYRGVVAEESDDPDGDVEGHGIRPRG